MATDTVKPSTSHTTSDSLPLHGIKHQGEGKELEKIQEDPVERETSQIKPPSANLQNEKNSNSHVTTTSRKKKHRPTRHKSRYGEWEVIL